MKKKKIMKGLKAKNILSRKVAKVAKKGNINRRLALPTCSVVLSRRSLLFSEDGRTQTQKKRIFFSESIKRRFTENIGNDVVAQRAALFSFMSFMIFTVKNQSSYASNATARYGSPVLMAAARFSAWMRKHFRSVVCSLRTG